MCDIFLIPALPFAFILTRIKLGQSWSSYLHKLKTVEPYPITLVLARGLNL